MAALINQYLSIDRAKILNDLEAIEKKGINLIVRDFQKFLINSTSNTVDLNINLTNSPLLGQAIFSIWIKGIEAGGTHGKQEIRKTAFAEAQKTKLRNPKAEKAVKDRINKLSGNVTKSEWGRIKEALLESVKGQIDRSQLVKKISEEIGGDRFKNRAQAIARTELTFAYNAGRLSSYLDSNLVGAVRYLTILDDRRCPICANSNNLIIPLSDRDAISRIFPPRHTKCRCILSPVLKSEYELKKENPLFSWRNRPRIPGSPWEMDNIINNL